MGPYLWFVHTGIDNEWQLFQVIYFRLLGTNLSPEFMLISILCQERHLEHTQMHFNETVVDNNHKINFIIFRQLSHFQVASDLRGNHPIS